METKRLGSFPWLESAILLALAIAAYELKKPFGLLAQHIFAPNAPRGSSYWITGAELLQLGAVVAGLAAAEGRPRRRALGPGRHRRALLRLPARDREHRGAEDRQHAAGRARRPADLGRRHLRLRVLRLRPGGGRADPPGVGPAGPGD